MLGRSDLDGLIDEVADMQPAHKTIFLVMSVRYWLSKMTLSNRLSDAREQALSDVKDTAYQELLGQSRASIASTQSMSRNCLQKFGILHKERLLPSRT